MAICGDVQVPLTIESQEGHVGTVSFTPTMAGKGAGLVLSGRSMCPAGGFCLMYVGDVAHS